MFREEDGEALGVLFAGVCCVAEACQWHLIATVSAYSRIDFLTYQSNSD